MSPQNVEDTRLVTDLWASLLETFPGQKPDDVHIGRLAILAVPAVRDSSAARSVGCFALCLFTLWSASRSKLLWFRNETL